MIDLNVRNIHSKNCEEINELRRTSSKVLQLNIIYTTPKSGRKSYLTFLSPKRMHGGLNKRWETIVKVKLLSFIIILRKF